jgi:hypothetical protein
MEYNQLDWISPQTVTPEKNQVNWEGVVEKKEKTKPPAPNDIFYGWLFFLLTARRLQLQRSPQGLF